MTIQMTKSRRENENRDSRAPSDDDSEEDRGRKSTTTTLPGSATKATKASSH